MIKKIIKTIRDNCNKVICNIKNIQIRSNKHINKYDIENKTILFRKCKDESISKCDIDINTNNDNDVIYFWDI